MHECKRVVCVREYILLKTRWRSMAPPAAGALKALVDILNSLVSHGMTIDKIPDDRPFACRCVFRRPLCLRLSVLLGGVAVHAFST